MAAKIKVLVVDDSGFMRLAIIKMLENYDDVEIVGQARDGAEGAELAMRLKPDVITMDVEMPNANGLQATQAIMQNQPVPIIMVSSVTQQGAKITLQALDLGAVDFVSKSSSFVQLDIVKVEKELVEKVRFWGQNKLRLVRDSLRANKSGVTTAPTKLLRGPVQPAGKPDIVVLAVSTGGPKQLQDVLKNMRALKCPMVIVQHMGANFTRSFAENLANKTGLNVYEGESGKEIRAGDVVIAPGGLNSWIKRGVSNNFYLQVRDEGEASVRPSANILFSSTAKVSNNAVAVIMTGMGNDGTEGAGAFVEKNWPVLVQQPDSCIVDGMPGAAIAAGVSSEVLGLEAIGQKLSRWAS